MVLQSYAEMHWLLHIEMIFKTVGKSKLYLWGVMEFIDSHCHLYLKEFAADFDEVIKRADREGVIRYYFPAVDSTTHHDMLALQDKYPETCYSMIGLHPCSVNEQYLNELRIVGDIYKQHSFVAIGEIGLDYYWDQSFKEQQMDAFRKQIELAIEYELPIVIHSRDSIDDCITSVGDYPELKRKGIFHCFSGNQQQADRIIELGFYLGIGGVVTYKNSGLAEVVANLPLDRIVLETDAPYLSPVPFRGKRNESSYLKYIAAKIAEVKGIALEEVAHVTTQNSQNIFGN